MLYDKKLGETGLFNKKYIHKLQKLLWNCNQAKQLQFVQIEKTVATVIYHSSKAGSLEAHHQFCDKDSQLCKMRIAERNGEDYIEKARGTMWNYVIK